MFPAQCLRASSCYQTKSHYKEDITTREGLPLCSWRDTQKQATFSTLFWGKLSHHLPIHSRSTVDVSSCGYRSYRENQHHPLQEKVSGLSLRWGCPQITERTQVTKFIEISGLQWALEIPQLQGWHERFSKADGIAQSGELYVWECEESRKGALLPPCCPLPFLNPRKIHEQKILNLTS